MPSEPNGSDVVMTLTFHRDSLEMDIDAPEVNLDFAMAMIERAKRLLEDQHIILRTNQISQGIRTQQINEERTKKVLDKVRLQ